MILSLQRWVPAAGSRAFNAASKKTPYEPDKGERQPYIFPCVEPWIVQFQGPAESSRVLEEPVLLPRLPLFQRKDRIPRSLQSVLQSPEIEQHPNSHLELSGSNILTVRAPFR